MDDQDLKRYREVLEKEYSVVNLKVESTLTYITTGALGFFMLMNGRYLSYVIADFKFLLPISLSFLFLSFVMTLIRKANIIKHEFELLSFVERMESNSENQEQELVSIWDKNYMNRTMIHTIICLGLALGIGLQILFMILNFR